MFVCFEVSYNVQQTSSGVTVACAVLWQICPQMQSTGPSWYYQFVKSSGINLMWAISFHLLNILNEELPPVIWSYSFLWSAFEYSHMFNSTSRSKPVRGRRKFGDENCLICRGFLLVLLSTIYRIRKPNKTPAPTKGTTA